MYVCISMYVCMYVRMYVCTYVCMYVCTYVCMYICMYVRMYVCISKQYLIGVSQNKGSANMVGLLWISSKAQPEMGPIRETPKAVTIGPLFFQPNQRFARPNPGGKANEKPEAGSWVCV